MIIFVMMLIREMGSVGRQGSDKTVRFILMIDLNKFKYINDQFGHVEGDKALKRTAEALKTACSDHSMKTFIARYGGDEFIVVAKTDNEEKVRELCRNIKDTLVRMNRDDNAGYELTASIGYSSYNGDITDFQQALAKADEALYREKAVMAAASRQN
ncbi:MAG: GGDEF domain-containing protein [Saccharofermentans sp.]|nr:GGDEF domain-containing protein [Saccharofermentans sp.]